jgi:hypothetical protein
MDIRLEGNAFYVLVLIVTDYSLHCRLTPLTSACLSSLQGEAVLSHLIVADVRWVPLSPHHGMSSVCGWKVAVNILNMQLQTNDKGWSSSLGFGVGLTAPHHKKQACYEAINRALDLDGFFG